MTHALARYVFFLEAEGRSSATVKTYRSVISRWERSGLDPIVYLANLNHGGVRSNTRAYYGIVLNDYLNWQVQCGLISENPLVGIRFRRRPPLPERPFSPSEIDALLAACRTAGEEALIICLVKLGVRASELCGIEPADIDEDTVTIRKGKGGKIRLLGLSPALRLGLLMVSLSNLNYRGIYRTVKIIGRRAGLAGVHPHRFRLTWADDCHQSGMNDSALMLLGGWSKLTMLQHYTAYYAQERALEAHRKFLES